MLEFKMFSALLSYPTSEMRAALDEMAGLIERSPLIAPAERPGLLALIASLGEGDLLDAEERYCELFDRGRALSLHLFEHLHGESRDRGTAMVELKQLYRAAGFDLVGNELPDYLPVVLEYLSCRELPEARDMLVDCAHILQVIARALIARQSNYAAVLQALLVIAGEQPVDVAKVPPAKERIEDLDRAWREEPAFGGDPQAAARPPAPARGGRHAME
ncbi:MAG TPA: nitrate reductase molybdenum cofactor assembly chaperone [Devosia sp.]|nr:nitrate reductase molybdenum cofactor assembly chaperone [Devosia sp.]